MSKVKTNRIGDYIRVLVSDPVIGNVKGKAAKVLDVFTKGVVVEFQIPDTKYPSRASGTQYTHAVGETCPVAFFEHSEVQRIPRLLN